MLQVPSPLIASRAEVHDTMRMLDPKKDALMMTIVQSWDSALANQSLMPAQEHNENNEEKEEKAKKSTTSWFFGGSRQAEVKATQSVRMNMPVSMPSQCSEDLTSLTSDRVLDCARAIAKQHAVAKGHVDKTLVALISSLEAKVKKWHGLWLQENVMKASPAAIGRLKASIPAVMRSHDVSHFHQAVLSSLSRRMHKL